MGKITLGQYASRARNITDPHVIVHAEVRGEMADHVVLTDR